jgi:hypothetical protein
VERADAPWGNGSRRGTAAGRGLTPANRHNGHVLRVEVILGIIASSIAILAFMARAYANIRRGRRIKRYAHEIDRRAERDLAQLREETEAAREMTARRRRKGGAE